MCPSPKRLTVEDRERTGGARDGVLTPSSRAPGRARRERERSFNKRGTHTWENETTIDRVSFFAADARVPRSSRCRALQRQSNPIDVAQSHFEFFFLRYVGTSSPPHSPHCHARLARCPSRRFTGGKGVSSPDMHIYFVSMEAFVATLTTAGSPRTCVSVEQRGETKSARENSESTLARTCTHPFLSSYISIRSDAGRIEVATVYSKCHGSSTTDSRGVRRSDRALPASVDNNLNKQRGIPPRADARYKGHRR